MVFNELFFILLIKVKVMSDYSHIRVTILFHYFKCNYRENSVRKVCKCLLYKGYCGQRRSLKKVHNKELEDCQDDDY